MKAITTLLAFTLLSITQQSAFAGAWTKNQGDAELIINQFTYYSDAFYDRDGNRQSQPGFFKYEINPYLEYGLTDDLTLGLSTFHQFLTQEDTDGAMTSNAGLGDTEAFARYQLIRSGPVAVSVQPLVKFPSLYLYDEAPRAGSNAFDAEAGLLGGYAFHLFGKKHYIDSKLAYRHRFHNELEDQLRADIKLGIQLTRRWHLIPAISTIWAIDASKDPVFTEDGQNDFDLIKFEMVGQYQYADARFIQFGAFGHVEGKNVGEGYGFILSYGLSF